MTKLSEIEERIERATPGPWSVWRDDTGGPFTGWPFIDAPKDMDLCIIHRAGFKQEFWGDLSQREAVRNAEFIAHSRIDLPWAVSEIRRLRGLLKEARDYVVTERDNQVLERRRKREEEFLARIDSALEEE